MGRPLATLKQLPNTGDVIPADEKDRVTRLLGMIAREAADRVSAQAKGAPPILLLVDGFATFRDTYEHMSGGIDAFQDLVEIARAGRNVGVHVVIASERAANLPAALAASVPERLSLSHPSEADYQMLGVPAAALEDAPPGRAIRIGSDQEIQFALPSATSDPSDVDAALAEIGASLRGAGVVEVEGVPEIPTRITRSEIVAQSGRNNAFAIDTVQMDPVDVPESGMLLVTGPAGSGRTTAIRTLVEACIERTSLAGQEIEAVLISPRRSQLRELSIWSSVADTSERREDEIERLILGLGGKVASPIGLAMLPMIGDLSEPEASEEPDVLAPPAFPRRGAQGCKVGDCVAARR